MQVLATIHQFVGYALVVVVLVITVLGFGRARDAREFIAGPYVVAAILLDVQVLIGLIVYGTGSYWESDSALVAYVHPSLALLALVAAHVGLKRARNQQMAVAAHRAAAQALLLALALIAAAIAAISIGLN